MGANIIITKPNGSRVPMESRATATAITAAKQTWALNAEDTIAITVVSPFPQSYGIGDVITVFGRDYRLNRLPKVSKTGMQEYQYDLEFEGIQYDLMRVTYDVNINTTNNKLQDIQGDSLTGDLKRFMEVLISNANRVFPGKWALGVCPETDGDNTLTFSESDNCLSVLQTLCSEDKFGVEFEIERVNGVYVINIKKTIGQTLPFVLEYGKGKGLYSISRENVSSSNIVTRLKVYGSTENITSKYRADRLCMFGKDKASSYIEKADAVAKYGIFEGRKNFDIKPTFTGKVSSAVNGDVLSFIDTSFPFDINAKNASGETLYLISGVSAKVHFNSGNLAGYEFEVHEYDHATHKFTLVKQTDDRGNVFPSETSPAFQIGKNDTYKVLDIAYSRDIEEAAEKKLAEEGNKYYDQNSQPKVQYSVNVTKAFIENKLALSDGITNVFAPGDYLPIKDDEIGVDKSIRIKSFTRNVLDPYDYSLTISDTQTKGDITTRVISDLVDIDKVLTINNLKDPAQARANWRSSREVLNMVFDPETGGYYKDKITPESVDTMMLSVGAKSMQFGLINTVFEPNFNGNPNLFKWKGGVLTHYTIDPDKARSWVLADGTTALQQDVPYYIYAVCNRDNSAGTMSISATQHKVEESPNVYFFLIGILGSIDADTKVRAISLTYGFTTINGRFIKTGRIESADGTTYFDLDKSEIGGRIVFTQNGQEKTLEELGSEAKESKDFINNTLPGILDEIKAQLDGQIETWFQTSDPASNWTTDTEKAKHVGDMWYNSSTKSLSCYRKTLRLVNGTTTVVYVWQTIEDKKAIDAYDAASKAQDTADGKRRVFVAQPYPPYDVGDLWVDGKELRRCITERASGSWNTNDWVVAVSYDNTQTTIDGGIVTSGTIQVAGDNKSILAGITGNGTASDSIRFWAGASFENRKTAPFRVMQDGSVVMSKAQVEGVINAITGSIGGFRIQQGQIGYGSSDEQDTTNGLALFRNFIRFCNDKQRVLLGCLSSLGYPFNGFMSLTDLMGTTLELHHDNPSTSDADNEYWFHPKALGVYGNQYNIGKVAAFENGYIGQAYTNIIELWFAITQKFHFTANTTNYLKVNLPTLAQVNKQTNNVPTIFDIEIVCDRNMGNRIRVSPQSGCTLYNNDGNSISGIDMERGDSLTLRYYNGGWMVVNNQYTT